jgi:hypothetical protein
LNPPSRLVRLVHGESRIAGIKIASRSRNYEMRHRLRLLSVYRTLEEIVQKIMVAAEVFENLKKFNPFTKTKKVRNIPDPIRSDTFWLVPIQIQPKLCKNKINKNRRSKTLIVEGWRLHL